MNRLFVTLLTFGAFISCGGEDDGPADATDSDGDAHRMSGSDHTIAPTPGTSEAGWMSEFNKDLDSSSCSEDEADYSGMPKITVGATTMYAGWQQVSGNNQDPFVARFDDGERIYCEYHENDGPDGRALSITWDGGEHAYVVYTVVGGGSDLEGRGGWLGAYAPGAISGGGPKVSYVGRVNVKDGSLSSGTFIISVLSSNKVNGHAPAGAVTVLEGGNVEFLGSSSHKPIDADGKHHMDCTDYPFDTRYVFSPDLSTLICAESTNCKSLLPCE